MFRRNQMEIIIGLLVVGGAAWFFFMRNGKKEEIAAPYKVESTPYVVPEPAATTKIPLVVDMLPAGTEASIAAPAKKAPAKTKAAAKPKAPAKTATAKAPAKTAKAKAPAKPKITVAK